MTTLPQEKRRLIMSFQALPPGSMLMLPVKLHLKMSAAIRKGLRRRQNQEALALYTNGFAPIFPDTCYHLTHYWPAAADIPVASDNPVHYADAIRYNARTPLQGSLLPLTRLV